MGKLVEILPSVLLLVIIISGFFIYAAEGSPKDLEQPIPFSHKVHAGENEIDYIPVITELTEGGKCLRLLKKAV